ncbi:MAG: ABC transporter ATP-binding protein [Crocinitomicaceae bacterium]
MSKVIEINNLSKVYDLGLVGTGTLSKDLNRTWAKLRGKPDPYATLVELNDRTKKSSSNMIYALKDINFSVEQGEILGIIGKNGAGKSTLLKILSQITSPSTGTIKMKGRAASLLEVGTGMHPEMTARQNIYLNGSLMGMRRHEITSKLDEIVDFAGIEKYIDTPTKRFSSGMTVRLGFAIAAFLEPEILIVDEVLAVGDAEFQKKAIGKMQDVSKGEGRTVLFVSHNMASVKSLCNRGIILQNGQMILDNDIDNAVSHYLTDGNDIANQRDFNDQIKTELFQLHKIKVSNSNVKTDEFINEHKEINITTEITIFSDHPKNYHVTYHMYNEQGEAMFSFASSKFTTLKKGDNLLITQIPEKFLQPGQYYLHFFLIENRKRAIYIEKDILSFNVVNGEREIGVYMGKEPGYIRPFFNWINKSNP